MTTESTVLVKYQLDKQGVSTTEAAGKRLIKQQELLGKSAREVARESARATSTLGDVDPRGVGKVASGWDNVAKSINRAETAQRNYNEEFDRTSRKVALAGDVESNLRAIGGAAGAAGMGGVAGGVGAVAEVPALVEALPRLKSSLAGLPSAAKSAAEALGRTGIGVGAALVGLVLIAKEVSAEIDKASDEVKGAIEVNRQYAEIMASGSREGAEAAIAEAQQRARVREIEREGLLEGQRNIQAMEDNASGLEQVVIRVGDVFKTMPIEEVENRLKELGQEAESDDTLIRRLTESLGQLGTASAQTALTAAQDAAQRLQLEQELASMGQEAAQARLQQLENERAVLIAQIEVLEASGDASEEVVARLHDLKAQLEGLDSSISQVSQHISSGAARAVDSAAKQKQAHEEAARAAEQSAQRARQAYEQYNDAVTNINRQTSQAISDARAKAKQSLKDLEKTFAEGGVEAIKKANYERMKAIVEFNRDAQKEARDNQRELADIRKEAARSEREAIRSRDFLALAELAERTKDELKDTKSRILSERKERDIAFQYNMSDLQQSQALERQERWKTYQKQQQDLRLNLKRQIADMHKGARRQLENAARARDKQLEIARQGAQGLLDIESKLWQERQRAAGGGASRRTPGRRSFNFQSPIARVGFV